jgi:methyl-accepting chemotaxis protein
MTRTTLRYDWYGALIGLGLPLLGSVLEGFRQFHSVAPAAIWRAHLSQPLLWIMDTTPFVLGMLGRIMVMQQATVVRQGQELFDKGQQLVALEQARRESFEGAARKLFHAAQGLLGTVSDFTATTGEAASSVRRVTVALNGLAQAASSAALTAETVIGIAAQAERASADGLRHSEASGVELIRLAEQVRQFSSAVEGLSLPLAGLRDLGGAFAGLADGAERLPEALARAEGDAADGALGEMLRRHAEVARREASRLKQLLVEVAGVRDEAARAAQAGGVHAAAAVRVAAQSGEIVRGLAVSLRESARAAKELARVAQEQEGDIEQVLKDMNEISHATAGTEASTRLVEREARALNGVAAELREAVKSGG